MIDDLREGFEQYLETEYAYLKDKNVTLSDAFYVYRHNVGIGFWEALRNEKTMEHGHFIKVIHHTILSF